jgi:hypothetical protein
MQTKSTYYGQHFHLDIVKNGEDTSFILSNTDDIKNHIIFNDEYELMDMVDFMLETIGEKK